MSLYSQPWISEESARRTLGNITQQDLGFLYSILDSHPEYSSIILTLIDVIRKACEIYLARAMDVSQKQIHRLVQEFIDKTSTFNATSPGGHILIWPFFVVGVECTNSKDREFAIGQLQHLWRWTGFGNTLYAIETLQKKWSSHSGSRWTDDIVDKVDVFIM